MTEKILSGKRMDRNLLYIHLSKLGHEIIKSLIFNYETIHRINQLLNFKKICGLQLPREPHRSTKTSATDWQMAVRPDNVIGITLRQV